MHNIFNIALVFRREALTITTPVKGCTNLKKLCISTATRPAHGEVVRPIYPSTNSDTYIVSRSKTVQCKHVLLYV